MTFLREAVITRLLSDWERTERAYLFTQTRDNQLLVLARGAELLRLQDTEKLVLCDGRNDRGYPGLMVWQEELSLRFGLSRRHYDVIQVAGNLNTKTEAETLVRAAKANGWQRIALVAAPFHVVRAFLTVLKTVQSEFPNLAVWSISTGVCNWQQQAAHSQGIVVAKRKDLIAGEWERIERYQAQGDLTSFEETLDYLDRRDIGEL